MSQATAKSETLPTWDLSDLYSGIDAPEIDADLKKFSQQSAKFKTAYKGKLALLPGDVFAKAIAEFERLSDLGGKLGSYAQLVYAGNMADSAISQFYQTLQEKLNTTSTETLFFTLEINKLSPAQMKEKLGSAKVSQYASWLRDVRAYLPHQLADNVEEMLHQKYVVGRAAWTRLFDETEASMKFTIDGHEYGSAAALDFLSHKDQKKRKAAAKEVGRVFGENIKLFALITNTLAKDKEIEDNARGFKAPISSRNLSNYVEDKVVDTLIATVRANYPALAHRYYTIKAKWLGQEQLDYWDRNAPLPSDIDKVYGWEESRDLVLSSYMAFSPTLAKIGKEFFDKNWIDVPTRAGKSPGAFAHPVVPSVHPYLLLNFQGKTRDVMTLAHELGHGVHQVLSARNGALMADTPLTLAETASVFGEQLTFQEILRREKDDKKRKLIIASKVEDMLNTVVRQIAFCEFERQLHDERRKGELSPERIGEIWMGVQKESLGPSLRFDQEYTVYWAYIPHFVHTPFYVYAYAFGDCLVNSLYGEYNQAQKKGKGQEFEKKYLAMLEAGGTLRHKELLKPFGLDATKPDFWQKGIDVISGLIDQLE